MASETIAASAGSLLAAAPGTRAWAQQQVQAGAASAILTAPTPNLRLAETVAVAPSLPPSSVASSVPSVPWAHYTFCPLSPSANSEAHWQEPIVRWNADAMMAGERRRVEISLPFNIDLFDTHDTLYRRILGDYLSEGWTYARLQEARERLFHLTRNTSLGLDWLFVTELPENIPQVLAEHRHPRETHQTWWEIVSREGQPPIANWWFGVRFSDQYGADLLVPDLLKVPAVVRFALCEPLLEGGVDLRHVQDDQTVEIDALTGDHGVYRPHEGRGLPTLHWVVVGGETGLCARPCHLGDLRDLALQCQSAGVPFFLKQLGSEPFGAGRDQKSQSALIALRDPNGADMAEWPEDLRLRQVPTPFAPYGQSGTAKGKASA